jgi:hypothetical protein
MGQYRSEWHDILERNRVFRDGYAEFNTTGAKVLSNIAWLISPKIDMDTHIMKYSLLELHNIIWMWILTNSLEVYISSNFDGECHEGNGYRSK